MFFNLVHYTIFRPKIVNFIPIYRYFGIYNVTKIPIYRYIGTKGPSLYWSLFIEIRCHMGDLISNNNDRWCESYISSTVEWRNQVTTLNPVLLGCYFMISVVWVFVLPAGDAPNYFPNSFSGPTDNKKFVEHREPIHGDISRYNTADDDNFTQTGNFWRNVSVKIRSN